MINKKKAVKEKKRKMRARQRSVSSEASMDSSCYSESESCSDGDEPCLSVAYSHMAFPDFDAGILENNDITLEVDQILEPVYNVEEVEKTKEYVERQYYYPRDKDIQLNKFWAETIESFIKDELDYLNLSSNFIFSCNSITEMIAVLSIMTFELEGESPDLNSDHGSLRIKAKNPTLVFCKETKEQEINMDERLDLDVIVSQCFFDPNDKFIYDQVDPSIKILKKINNFVIGRRYTSKVTVTNSSEVPLALQVVTEIPEKSIPVNNLKEDQIINVFVQPMTTSKAQFDFYFPQEGNFKYYPATVLKSGRFVKSANLLKTSHISEIGENGILRVFAQKIKGEKMDTINDVLSLGKKSDILGFMENANLFNENVFNIDDILWLLKDQEFFKSVLKILRKKLMFNEKVWSFSILHGMKEEFYEYLAYKQNTGHLSKFKYLRLDSNIEIDRLNAKEYHPLTNPRIHDIGEHKHNILNNDFKNCYRDFLQYCFEKGQLGPRDQLILCSYLILQDRVKEALEIFSQMKTENYTNVKRMSIQYDYLKAYLSLYTEYPTFKTAREISEKYIAHHLLSWRNRFINIANQLTEYDGSEFVDINESNGGKVEIYEEDKLIQGNVDESGSKKKEILRAKLNGEQIEIRTRNIGEVVVKYYLTDLEFLFSKDPFLSQGMKTFMYVQANQEETVNIDLNGEKEPGNEELILTSFSVPSDLKTKNLLIYVERGTEVLNPEQKSRTKKMSLIEPIMLTYFPITFKLKIFPNSGLIRTSDAATHKPISKIYIKSFCKTVSGNIKFFKDGYTDLRGIFDYAGGVVSSEKIKEFSILVKDENLGSIVRVVDAPDGSAKANSNVIRSKKFDGVSTKYLQERMAVESVEIKGEGLRKRQIQLLKTFGEI